MTGFDGPITIASAVAIACRYFRGGAGGTRAVEVDVLNRPGPAGPDHELLERPPAFAGHHAGPDGEVGHRQDPAGRVQCVGDRGVGIGESLALLEPAGALDPDRQILVAEVEPHVDRQALEAVHHVEGVAGDAPAALVDPIGEPERDQVGVGRHVRAVDLDVVAGVRDHDELVGSDHVEHAAGELCAASPAGEHDDRPAHGVVEPRSGGAVPTATAGAVNASPGR